ncbi:unnamed protein product [Linum trigynum]|uniref:Retrotransposon gag domain-containing protein n=1 Tax=Linum trigynum TaxID=586398 RepID=A0AAV2FVL4_9ROSI
MKPRWRLIKIPKRELRNRGPWDTIWLHGRRISSRPLCIHPRSPTIPRPSLTMIQNNVKFQGLKDKSPREHIQRFVEIAGSLKINGVPEEALNLRLFPYYTAGNELKWLNNITALSINS